MSNEAPDDVADEEDHPLKKIPRANPPACCSCMEEGLPYLVLVGCSNRHTICHVCARMLISSKVVMQKFPQSFPGKISDLSDLGCPLCREPINGITNMFVTDGLDAEKEYECPYVELLDHRHHHCKSMKLLDLHAHIIRAHNQSVKCPNCLMWLGAEYDVEQDEKLSDRNMSGLLQFHIMKQCQKVKCHGCDRTGNMINMYMHSSVGRDVGGVVCESAKDMFRLFGENLAESAFMFEEPEDLTFLSSTMLRWTLQYFYQRTKPLDGGSEKEFKRLFRAFFLTMFCTLHQAESASDSAESHEPIDRMIHEFLDVTESGQPGEYEEKVLLNVSMFAKHRGLRLDRVSTLPFFYRILVMALSDSCHARNYPRDLSVEEETILAQLVQFYGKLIPKTVGLTDPPTMMFRFVPR